MTRKRRTRQHVLEDLSRIHLERLAISCGYTTQGVNQDYGIDLLLFTYNGNGEMENGYIGIQLKSTDSLVTLRDGATISLVIERGHLDAWLTEIMPVILAVYDAQTSLAYWQYVQRYFGLLKEFDLSRVGKTYTIHIPRQNVLDQAAIRRFRTYRDTIVRQAREVIRHDQT